MMTTNLKSYFQEYGWAFKEPDEIADFYGDFTIASGPGFVGGLKGRQEILEHVRQVAEYQKKTGMKSLRPEAVTETKVDDLHTWVKVTWEAQFEKTGDKVVAFDISYLLRESGTKPKIVLQISHQDEMKMRQELGVA